MSVLKRKFRQYFWFLFPEKTVFESDGLYSKVKVTKKGDIVSMYTGGKYRQSALNPFSVPHGSHFDWYLAAPWFSGNFTGMLDAVLILGLGGGAQVKRYNQVYSVKEMTGVELDPVIVSVAQKYFDLSASNVKAVIADAAEYLRADKYLHDLIILDVFKENVFESALESLEFLQVARDHIKPGGVFFINKLLDDPANLLLGRNLKKTFNTVITMRIYYNIFFVSTSSSKAPKTVEAAYKTLTEASANNPKLRFLRNIDKKDITIL